MKKTQVNGSVRQRESGQQEDKKQKSQAGNGRGLKN